MIAMQEAISLARNRKRSAATFPVLVEGPARRGEGMLSGKTPQFKTAIFPRPKGSRSATPSTCASSPPPRHSLMCSLA